MRVLVVPQDYPTPDDPTAGIFNARCVEALTALGHDVAVMRIVPWAPPVGPGKWAQYRNIPANASDDGVDVRGIRALVLPRMLGLAAVSMQVAGRIRAEIARHRAEIVHVHGLLPTARYTLDLPVPTVLTAHGTDAYRTPWRRGDLQRAARRAIKSVTVAVGVSAFIARQLTALGAARPRVIWNGADAAIFRPADRDAARDRLCVPRDRDVIVFAGHLLAQKGVFVLAEAMRLLADRRPLLYIAGAGADRDELERRLAAGRIDARFAGVLTQPQLADAFTAADVVTLPSRREGLPAVVCEAMLAARPVVATPVGGIPEIVRDGQTGRLVPVDDAPALGAALRGILADPAERDALGRAAGQFAATHLTWSTNARAYTDLYLEATSGRRVSAHADRLVS